MTTEKKDYFLNYFFLITVYVGILTFVGQTKEGEEDILNNPYVRNLASGNERFRSGCPNPKYFNAGSVGLTEREQPNAIIVTYSASPVKPETIFDEPFGSLLVIRASRLGIDSTVLSSIEYAIEHLHAGLVVVLDHTSAKKADSIESSPENVKENINNQIAQLRFKSDALYQCEREKRVLIVGAVYDGKDGKVNFFK